MHRIIAFLLLSLYLPAALNATVTAHYCMGKLAGVDVMASVPAGNTCSKCSMLKKNQSGCCHDKQETLKLNKDQLASGVNNNPQVPVYHIQPPSLFPDLLVSHDRYSVPSAHSPPLFTPVSLLLLHCVFRI